METTFRTYRCVQRSQNVIGTFPSTDCYFSNGIRAKLQWFKAPQDVSADCSMSQELLNSLAILHVHKRSTRQIDVIKAARVCWSFNRTLCMSTNQQTEKNEIRT